MESGDLKIFQAVAREGSITKAAQMLNYVQSNVTARVHNLEEDLNIRLFHRTNRGMKLTAAGENLLQYADQVLSLLDQAEKSTRMSRQPKGPLRIGSLETMAVTHLPEHAASFLRRFPEVDLSVNTADTHHLIQQVLDHKVDGAFVYGPVEHAAIRQLHVSHDELVLISSQEGTSEDMLQQPMLFFGAGCSHRDRVKRLLEEAGIQNQKIIEFGTLEPIIKGVSAGMGTALLPKSAVDGYEHRTNVWIHQLPPAYQDLEIVFIYRKDFFITSAFQTFLDEINEMKR
ncbi:LysR family transcriptional regulator YofA [Bacillus subtilis]|uniref:LysR family transcriptional regulator YofA n=1 Tax=Bacillus subtilis TaxID=1423 RepID=A0AAX3RMZ2_BACIU|nr:LysR family transcriptional regulator YofA [Bacillus subtilis]MED3696317.1 LysR family transcriptional regulator YofA [Bacillus subtilis]OTQ87966.1 transcriptional regulator [Bacillus subtilis subsp. subtilis]WEY83579.1 LysR family transcriptional regulator YofA [Bacillus subtilis]WEY96400.1 LysR family transcriptional regulator YofA [Bacillus subtilis]